MAFASTTQWDVRTTGSDSNGGGFDTSSSGTDYSLQDSPQITYTDMVIDGTTNTKFTSAGNPVTSAHVGNVINVTSGTGFTVQRVQIVSQAAGVATCDKSLGTLSSTGGNGKLGGSLLVPITAINLMVTSNTTHIKSGTYTKTTNSTFSGTPNGPLYIVGYGTTHNDGGTKPLLTTATNNIDNFRVGIGNNGLVRFVNISFSSTAGTPGFGLAANGQCQLIVISCIFAGHKNAINGDNFGNITNFAQGIVLIGSEIKNCTSHGIFQNGTTAIFDSWIHGCTGDGCVTVSLICVRSIISSNSVGLIGYSAGNPVNAGNAWLSESCLVSNSSDGIQSANAYLSNCIVYGNGGWGVNGSGGAASGHANFFNAFGSNTSGAYQNFMTGLSEVTLTANPFTNSGTGDFSLNSTAGGGPLLKQLGFPGAFPGGVSTGYLDIGAIQSQGAVTNNTYVLTQNVTQYIDEGGT
jgi:hypothetical protein